jgi:hypothetical protein
MRPRKFGHHGEATWVVADGLLTVESAYGTITTQLGGHEHTPELLARLLLNELIAEGLTRGDGAA